MQSLWPGRGPRVMQVGITERCNYHCLMCATHSPLVPGQPPEGERPQMPLAQFRALVEELGRLEVGWADLVGLGEPLLHPDFFEMAVAAKAAGLKVHLSTNGAMLTLAKAERLVEIGLDSMNVSINAGSDDVYHEVHPTASVGARERILESLRAMRAHATRIGKPVPLIGLTAVVFKQTYRDLPALVQAAAETGVIRVGFLPMAAVAATQALALSAEEWQEARGVLAAAEELGRHVGVSTNAPSLLAAEQPTAAREAHRRISCYAGHVFGLVYADGQVRFCCGCGLTVGNINTQSFGEIWHGREYVRLREMALGLPRTGEVAEGCTCLSSCPHTPHNIAVHNALYPRAARPAPVTLDRRFVPEPR